MIDIKPDFLVLLIKGSGLNQVSRSRIRIPAGYINDIDPEPDPQKKISLYHNLQRSLQSNYKILVINARTSINTREIKMKFLLNNMCNNI